MPSARHVNAIEEVRSASLPCRFSVLLPHPMNLPPSPMRTTDPQHAQLTLFADPHEVAPDVFMHASFVNNYALRLPAGLLVIDPGFEHMAETVHQAVRAWTAAPLHSAVYTHGHADHAF